MAGIRRWVRRLLRKLPPPLGDFAEPPFEEDALVPRRPRRPLGSGSVALELPVAPEDVDAQGHEA